MVLNNYNDQIRDMIKKVIDKYYLKGLSINQGIEKFRYYLYEVESSNNSQERKTRDNCILCAYLDTLYFTIYKHKMCMMKPDDMDLLNRLCQLHDRNDVLAEVSCDPAFLSTLLLNSYEFSSLTYLGKITLIKSLTDVEHSWLSNKNIMHIIDLNTYGKKITMDDLVLDIKEQLKVHEKLLDIDFNDGILLNISGFISNLMRFDQANGIDLVLNIGKIDYGVSKYLEKRGLLDDGIIDHIDYYENYSSDDIIYRLIYDMSFLQDALSMFMSLYIYQNYDDISLNEEILNTNDVKKIVKKLNPNKK